MKRVGVSIADSKDKLVVIKNDVQGLFSRVFEKPLTDEAWEHFYLNAPLGCAASFIGYAENVLIAHGGIIPQRLVSKNGKQHDYYLQTAVMIDKKYRNLHIFKALMEIIHQYIRERGTFVLAFPNDSAYLPFIKFLEWRRIREFNIGQYVFGRGPGSLKQDNENNRIDYEYSLCEDERFLDWRGELNHLKIYQKDNCKVIYKDYYGSLELLDIQGNDIGLKEMMSDLGYERINIAACFLSLCSLDGLIFKENIGIPQRMCVWPARYAKIDYESIKPSLLLSDVF